MVGMEERAERLNSLLESRDAEFHVSLQRIWKENRIQEAYVLGGGTHNCYPVFYYDRSWYDKSDEAVADFLMKNASLSCNIATGELLKADYLKKHILPRVVNGSNLEDLKKCGIACRPYLDLAVLYYLPVEELADPEKGKASIQVSERILSGAGMDEEEAYNYAMRNFAEVVDAMPIEQILAGFTNDYAKMQSECIPPCSMWVVSNKELCFGAAALLFGETLFRTFEEKFREQFGKEKRALVLPSSQHEILIVPCLDEDPLEDYLEMVKEVNDFCVSESEFLSDNIYYFDHKQKMVRAFV
ncbi:MAG: DUF5688 family protein [Clostridiales bacterium]|nr:DUF5688 family protein [Clostridiales bacterium]